MNFRIPFVYEGENVKDEFRKEQKKECADGSKNKRGKYGCSCCRKERNLNTHKKVSRRLARVRLKEKDQKSLD